MARVETQGLRRTVGVPGMFATAYGNLGSSIYYSLGLVAVYALGLTPVVFMFAGGLFALTAKTYAEAASMFPEAGGSSSFARHAINEVASFVAGWALSLDYIITIAISAFFVPHYLSAFWAPLAHNPGDIFGGIVVIALLVVVNVRGLGESAKLNVGLAVADLFTQVLLVCFGAIFALHPATLIHQVHLGVAPTTGQLLFAVSISMLAYTGIETVSNMAEEARDPGRDVPRTVNLLLIAVLGVYAGITVIGISALPVVHHGSAYTTLLGTKYQSDPVLGIIAALHLSAGVTQVLSYYVAILAATILIIATNAGMIGISRLSWSLAEHRQLPPVFARLHRRYRTPYFTIAFFSVIAALLLLQGSNSFLANVYSFGAMMSFTIAHASVVILRIREPDRERPYRVGGNVRIRGRDIPLTAVVGGLGTFATWVSLIALHGDARYIGAGWLLVGLVGYLLYRRHLGLDPRLTYRLEHHRPPAWFKELEYGSALVPIFSTDVDGRALRAAARLVGPEATVDCVYVIRVPSHLPVDARLDEEEAVGRSVLEAARVAGRRAGVKKVQTRLLRARNPGAALVEEAQRTKAEIVYLGTTHAPPAERALGPTACYLLTKRPCRIIVESGPEAARREPVAQRETPERLPAGSPAGGAAG
jgi:basic amino acid/polyamine antiporter, APA family